VVRKFLAGKLGKHAASDELLNEINVLCLSKDPTAAFEERKSFLEVVEAFRENPAAKKLVAEESAETVAAGLHKKFPALDARLERHIADFQWVNTEYVSPEWPKSRYIEELKPLVKHDGVSLLEEHMEKFNAQMRAKVELIERLEPPADVLKAVEALEEFMYEFDWAKAYYCIAFLNWRPFINELAKRMRRGASDVLLHTPDEIEEFLSTRKQPSASVIEARKRGFALVMLDEDIRLIEEASEKNEAVAKREGVFETVFGGAESARELKGMVASPGKVRGPVRVVTSVRDLPSVRKGDVLVTYMTTMEFTPVFHKAAAIVTDEGGLFSHAAIVSREFGLPCVVGTRKATRVFKNGDSVEVDAEKGIVRKINA
jgi:phosphoenolpyruvate synthase/pyruvate phosphate dikinase